MKPTFIIIGAQKCATTFVHKCIMEHPGIYMPHGEIPYFESPDYEQHSINLEKLFEGRSEKELGIKRPSYIGRPEVPSRIRNELPCAKLIAVLRSPIDRAISAYFHNISYGFLPIVGIEDGMKQIIQGAYDANYKRSSEIIEYGFYYKYLHMYKYFFDKDRILVILHEDLEQDKAGVIKKVFSFLNVDNDYIPRAINSKPMANTYNMMLLHLLQMRNRLTFRYNQDNTRLYIRENKINYFLGKTIVGVERLWKILIRDKKPVLSNSLHEELVHIYKQDIERLSLILNRDLHNWLH